MHWLKEHGISSSYDDYMSLPEDVLQDARLLMEADVRQAAAQEVQHGRDS